MRSRYVWMAPALVTLYVLYSHDYIKTIETNLRFLHEKILPEFPTLKSYLFRENGGDKSAEIFSETRLAKHANVENGLYLAIMGEVYDVTRGEKHYGPGGSYRYFVGRDASLAFVTGDFTEKGLTDDVSSLSPQQVKSLNDWREFYAKDYVFKGKLVGRYYDSSGNPTAEYRRIKEQLALAEKENSDEERRKRLFPPCNIEWKPEVGTRVWCSKKSGGIERDWIGVPRMLYEPGSDQQRCTCVNLKSKEYEIHRGNLREYEGCARGATNCAVKNS